MTRCDPRRRSAGFPIGVTLLAALMFTALCALGVWQIERLAWKRDLIARVDARIHAAPVAAPSSETKDDEYRRVETRGVFLHDRATLVQAATIKGAGYWVMTPLRRADGGIILINRGFVPPDAKSTYDRPNGSIRVTGLLRLTEPGGGFLRSNDPASNRWYSRDVEAIARERHLSPAPRPYFIDADAASKPGAYPVGGLTVVSFPNNHLQYAITWFVLAAMVVAAYIFAMRQLRKDRQA